MHYTISPDALGIASDREVPTLGIVRVHYVPGHDLGKGWTRHIVQLEKGDTADNPASTKGPIYGPAVVVYDVAHSGIMVHVHDNAGEHYDALRAFDDEGILRRLVAINEASSGKGDQGAFDVWNEVHAILVERGLEENVA